jgi:hypothetical protein
VRPDRREGTLVASRPVGGSAAGLRVRIVDRDAAEGTLGEDGGIRHRNRWHRDHHTPHHHPGRLDPARSVRRQGGRLDAEQAQAPAHRALRHLSPSIIPMRHFLPVDLTVSWAYAEKKSREFRCLYVPDTTEWE